MEPTISASTIQDGDTPRNMWSRMGVILNGGFVLTASPGDIGTQAKGIKKRETGSHTITGRIEDDIKIAISRKGEHYNELAVEDPKIAGFYICLDDMGQIIRNDIVPIQEIAAAAKEFDLSFYAIRNGIAYEADYDFENKSVISKEKISPDQFIQKQFRVSEMQKEKIIEDLFSSEPPFDVYAIKSHVEALYIDSRNQGQETYIEINASKNPSGFKKEYKEINGEQFEIITEFQEIGKRVLYYIEKGQLVKRQKYRNDPRIWEKFISKFDESGLGYIDIGFNTHNLERPIDNNEDYISGMETSVEKLIKERREIIVNEKYKGRTEFYNEWLDKLAFHLYGFGEQAKQFGDIKSQERVFKLANQIMPYEKYQEILQRRIDEQGRFKITMEDLI